MRYVMSNHDKLRGLSFWLGLIGFGCFVQGYPAAALCIRMITELCRLPSFYVMRMPDQVRLSWFILAGCLYGLHRIAEA